MEPVQEQEVELMRDQEVKLVMGQEVELVKDQEVELVTDWQDQEVKLLMDQEGQEVELVKDQENQKVQLVKDQEDQRVELMDQVVKLVKDQKDQEVEQMDPKDQDVLEIPVWTVRNHPDGRVQIALPPGPAAGHLGSAVGPPGSVAGLKVLLLLLLRPQLTSLLLCLVFSVGGPDGGGVDRQGDNQLAASHFSETITWSHDGPTW